MSFIVGVLVLNDAEARAIHLAFALCLAALLRPVPPLAGLSLAGLGTVAAGYIFWQYGELSGRPGAPTAVDVIVAVIGLAVLLAAVWRSIGRLVAILLVLLLAVAFAVRGSPALHAADLWFGNRAVYGPALGAATQVLFLYVLFGALLTAWGAPARWARFLDLLFAGRRDRVENTLLGTGLVQGGFAGSALAAADGMRRVRWPWEIGPQRGAAALLASSTLAQAMPPLFGLAVFAVAEPFGQRLGEAVAAALLPAALGILGLFAYFRLSRPPESGGGPPRPMQIVLATAGIGLVGIASWLGIVLFAEARALYGGRTSWLLGGTTSLVYLLLLRFETRLGAAVERSLAAAGLAAFRTALPVCVMLWCLFVEGLAPTLAGFWSLCFMIFVMLADPPAQALMGPRGAARPRMRQALLQVEVGLVRGATLAVPVAIGAAGLGLMIGAGEAIELLRHLFDALHAISLGSLVPAVLAAAAMALAVGLIVPTPVAYMAVAWILAPMLLDVAGRTGVALPHVVAHLALFLLTVVGAALPGGQLAKAAPTAEARRTAIAGLLPMAAAALALPFNPELSALVWTDPRAWVTGCLTAALGVIGVAALAAGRWFAANRAGEALLLALASASLLAPSVWFDRFGPPSESIEPRRLVALAGELPEAAVVILTVGDTAPRAVRLPLGRGAGGAERLAATGIELRQEGEQVRIERVAPGSRADRLGLAAGQPVRAVRQPVPRPSLLLVLVPVLAVLAFLGWRQRSRLPLR